MSGYRVVWEIDIDGAGSAVEAAQQARQIQQDRDSTAVVFTVRDSQGDPQSEQIDLADVEECTECFAAYLSRDLLNGGLCGGARVCRDCCTCRSENCDERNDDGEGCDGYCGNCADKHCSQDAAEDEAGDAQDDDSDLMIDGQAS